MAIMKRLVTGFINDDATHDRVLKLIDELFETNDLPVDGIEYILDNISFMETEYLFKAGRDTATKHYDNTVYMRALIEFTNVCVQNCNYCGLRKDNLDLERYRMTKNEIIECCKIGDGLGYKTFVLQGGEDPFFTDEILCDIIKDIKIAFPDNAITLSFGEQTLETYSKYREAGCDRYLLRHEAASKELYEMLHPTTMSYDNRIKCLDNLKTLDYQVGAGFMVGTPKQTNKNLVADLLLIKKINPEMCGIGPYISHSKTPLAGNESGTSTQTSIMISLVRMLVPKCLLPAATALGSVDNFGRELALKAGANVVMPKITPTKKRSLYELYENMICLDDEPQDCRYCIEGRINSCGLRVDLQRGDHIDLQGGKYE